ncbi:hypothetical protein M3J09_009095 [Ascochyta lentis]
MRRPQPSEQSFWRPSVQASNCQHTTRFRCASQTCIQITRGFRARSCSFLKGLQRHVSIATRRTPRKVSRVQTASSQSRPHSLKTIISIPPRRRNNDIFLYCNPAMPSAPHYDHLNITILTISTSSRTLQYPASTSTQMSAPRPLVYSKLALLLRRPWQ